MNYSEYFHIFRLTIKKCKIFLPCQKFNFINETIFFILFCRLLFQKHKLSANKQWLKARFSFTFMWSNGCFLDHKQTLVFHPKEEKKTSAATMWVILKMRWMYVYMYVCANNYLRHVHTVSCNSRHRRTWRRCAFSVLIIMLIMLNSCSKWKCRNFICACRICTSRTVRPKRYTAKQNNVKKSNEENTKWTDKNVYEESRFYFNVSQRNNVVIITTA